METRYRSAPGFLASLGGALAGYFAGAVLALLLLWPFALASSTALAVGSVDGYRGLGGLVLAALLLAAAQVAITAWITQQAASLLGDAPVGFGRALGAVFLGYLANVFVGSAIAGVAELPVVGGAWIGPYCGCCLGPARSPLLRPSSPAPSGLRA